MRYWLLCLFLFLISAGGVSAQPDSLLHTSYAKRHAYVNEFKIWLCKYEDPQFALDSVQKIIKKVKAAEDYAFMYHLTFMQIAEETYMQRPDALKMVIKQIREAEDEGYIYEATDAKTKLALHRWEIGKRTNAMELELNTYNIYKNFAIKDFPERLYAQTRLATWYHYYKDYTKAKQLLLELSVAANGEISERTLWPLMTLGLIYRETGQYDSALFYLKQVYNEGEKLNSLQREALAAGTIGSIYFLYQDYDSALIWLKRELEVWKQENNNSTLPSGSVYAFVADVYLKKKNLATAELYIDSATTLMRKVRRSFLALRKFYEVKARVLTAQGKYTEALKYKDSVTVMVDSMYHARDKAHLMAAEQKVADARHEREMEYLESIREKSVWIRNFAILLIAFAAVVIIFIINRSRQIHKEKQLLLENEKNKAQADLLKFTKTLQDKNRQLATLQEEITELTNQQDIASQNELIYQLQQSTILTDEEWVAFRDVFEQVHAGYITRVKTRHPEVTPAEIRYMVLIMLDMSTKEIANVLGISAVTVRNLKHRMRKKFDVDEDVTLETFIKAI